MTLEQCIRDYEERYGLERGATCDQRHGLVDVDFQPCECSRSDPSYLGPNGERDYFDYIGRGPNDGVWYVGASRKITVGQNGYHIDRGEPCV